MPNSPAIDALPPTSAQPGATKKIIASALLATIAPQGVWMMPLIVGSFAGRIEMSNSGAGLLASVALLGACLMALAQALLYRLARQRMVTGACLVALIVAYGGLMLTPSYGLGLLLMGILGLGMGGLLVIAMTAAAQTGKQTQVIALGFVGQGALAAALAWAVSLVSETEAVTWLPLLLLGTAVAGLAAIPGIPNAPMAETRRIVDTDAPGLEAVGRWPLILALAAWGLINFSNGGFWPMIERTAAADGFANADISRAMSMTSMAGLVAALGTLVIGRRFGLRWPIILTGLGTVVSIMAIVWTPTLPTFNGAMILFGLLWSVGPAYQLPVVAEADSAGSGMAWSILVMKASMAVGPVIYGALADYSGYVLAGVVSSIAAGVSTLLFIAALLASRRAQATALQ